MKSQTAHQITKQLGEPFAQLKSSLGSFLSQSSEDKGLQTVLRAEIHSTMVDMLASEEMEGLAEELGITELSVIGSQVLSFQVFPETILIHWCADAIEPGKEWSIQSDVTKDGYLVEGVDAEQMIHVSGLTGIDTVNNQSYSTVSNISCTRRVDIIDQNGDKAPSLLPFNKLAEHISVPLKVVVEKKYGNLKKGTILTLDHETMIYRDQDNKSGGVPADFIMHVFFQSNPSGALGQTFSADDFSAGIPFNGAYQEGDEYEDEDEDPSEAEQLGGFLAQTQGDMDADDGIQDSLLDEILKRNRNNE